MLNDYEAARMLGVRPATLRNWRVCKTGPVYFKIKGAVRYREDGLVEYILQHKGTRHQALLDQISGLEARQEVLQSEIAALREEGVTRISENKANSAISAKINARLAEETENQGWLAKLHPQAGELAEQLAAENRNLLEAMRVQIMPFHAAKEVEMNDHFEQASRLKNSWSETCAQALDQIGDQEHFSNGISISMAFRLKVDWERSAFRSPGR